MRERGPRAGRLGAWLLVSLLAGAILTGCGGSGSKPAAKSAGPSGPAEATTAGEDSSTTLPPGAVAGLDDYDGNGEMDPTCGTQDFGEGLVLRIPCAITTANEPPQGVTLTEGSLFRLPGPTDVNMDGISGSLVLARDVPGAKVAIVVFNSDNLFETGSATIGSTDTLDGTIRLVNSLYPNSVVKVRGHTDSSGSTGANQSLSADRATTVQNYLREHGANATQITAVGLGSSQPLALEHNPDGSENAEGMHFNRRVEIVVRVP